MKRLWKTIPPCYSDVLGMEAIVNQTGGFGLIDDPSRYKPLRTGSDRHAHPKDAPRRTERGEEGLRYFRGSESPKPHERHGGPADRAGVRVVNSDIRNEDIIHGTERKVLDTFFTYIQLQSPDFVLLSYAPSSSMIGSDLDDAARQIAGTSGIPTACVPIHGDKDYLYGMSLTMETMGRLLLAPADQTISGSVNLLGCNPLDWAEETADQVTAMLEHAGHPVLSKWGIKETTDHLKQATAAAVNLVVNISGIRLATYMEQAFGIPFYVGAPFGAAAWGALQTSLKTGHSVVKAPSTDALEAPEILILGEQLTANALRLALQARGANHTCVASFYEMDRALMQPGDQKLAGEDDLARLLSQPSLRLVFGDPDYQALANCELAWIDLPNGGSQFPVHAVANFDMAGDALDRWLDGAAMKLSKVGGLSL